MIQIVNDLEGDIVVSSSLVRGIPVIPLETPPMYPLPVGIITVTSTVEEMDSGIHSAQELFFDHNAYSNSIGIYSSDTYTFPATTPDSMIMDISQDEEDENGYLIVPLDGSLTLSKEESEDPFINEVISCLEQIYPGMYEIKPKEKGDKDNYYIFIRFPEVEIKNSTGTSHIIRDLFIRMDFKKSTKIIRYLEGARCSYSYAEYKSNYRHSHLVSGTGTSFNSFCLGSGEIGYTLAKLMKGFNPLIFKSLLIQIGVYVEWESLEGGPYITIANISAGGRLSTISDTTCNNAYKELIRTIKSFPVSFIEASTHNQFKIDPKNSEFEQLVYEALRYEYEELVVNKILSTDTYVPTSYDSLLHIKEIDILNNKKTEFIVFRGEQLYFRIYQLDSGLDNLVPVMHPDITKYVAKELEKQINDYHLNLIGCQQ